MTIYFDNSATTPVRKEVVDAMITFLSDSFGNPSSIHCMGRDSFKAVAKARQNVAKLLNCEPTEVYFTDDPKRYRSEEESKEWFGKEPLTRFAKYLQNKGVMTAKDLEEMEACI